MVADHAGAAKIIAAAKVAVVNFISIILRCEPVIHSVWGDRWCRVMRVARISG